MCLHYVFLHSMFPHNVFPNCVKSFFCHVTLHSSRFSTTQIDQHFNKLSLIYHDMFWQFFKVKKCHWSMRPIIWKILKLPTVITFFD